jgi:hypothetical protein
MAEMSFAEHNNMVETIPSDRTDEPLRRSVLPWRSCRDRPIPYAHCASIFFLLLLGLVGRKLEHACDAPLEDI